MSKMFNQISIASKLKMLMAAAVTAATLYAGYQGYQVYNAMIDTCTTTDSSDVTQNVIDSSGCQFVRSKFSHS